MRGRPKGSRTRPLHERERQPSPPRAPHLEKRSLDLRGRRTTTTLEPEFWGVLERVARSRCVELENVVRDVDTFRGTQDLAPALRLHALRWLLAREAAGGLP